MKWLPILPLQLTIENLKHQRIIQKMIAACLMLVLATGVAPKAFLHDVFADHHDTPGCTIDHDTDVLHNVQVHCDLDDLVVPASYVPQQVSSPGVPFLYLPSGSPELKNHYTTVFLQSCLSRGPPSA